MEFVRSLDQSVQFVKSLEKVRREYMILSDEIKRHQEEAADKAAAESMVKGIAKGLGLSDDEIRALAEMEES